VSDKAWGGRFEKETDAALAAFARSLPLDQRLWPYDLALSTAHVRMLAAQGILGPEDANRLIDGLVGLSKAFAAGEIAFGDADEDIHLMIERLLFERVGEAAGRLHTGRSRNDQVATDLHLYLRAVAGDHMAALTALLESLVARAREALEQNLIVPGYTHLQRAQPVLLAHALLAHGWALSRDVDRLVATVERLNVSPLGAGALAGSSLALDPDYVAEELGFLARFENSLDAVSDRDFVAEALFDLSLLSVHLSKMGEEIVLWSSAEFGFCILDDAYATGSSMLPQKKNPDIAELARGKAGRMIGHVTAILATLKGLPLAYNRDLQEDKEPLFDAVGQMGNVLRAMTAVYATVTWNQERMQGAADESDAAAVDLAEMLVDNGMPFRQAYALVGGLVRESAERHVPLVELVEAHPDLGEAATRLLEPGVAVTRRTTPGGAGPVPVAEQLERFVRRLDVDRARLSLKPGAAPAVS
jgi:argininosuccinate lyase